jgi:hypothetical protein
MANCKLHARDDDERLEGKSDVSPAGKGARGYRTSRGSRRPRGGATSLRGWTIAGPPHLASASAGAGASSVARTTRSSSDGATLAARQLRALPDRASSCPARPPTGLPRTPSPASPCLLSPSGGRGRLRRNNHEAALWDRAVARHGRHCCETRAGAQAGLGRRQAAGPGRCWHPPLLHRRGAWLEDVRTRHHCLTPSPCLPACHHPSGTRRPCARAACAHMV